MALEPTEPIDGVTHNPDVSGLHAFVELRELPDVELVRDELAELASEARDPSWSAQMEAQLQSELSRTNLTLTGSYIECKTSTCIAILIRPSSAYNQTQQVGPPNGEFTRAMLNISQTQGLLLRPPRQLLARNGALVHWQRFFRRCAPDWECPQ
jgi:hypothetical protein